MEFELILLSSLLAIFKVEVNFARSVLFKDFKASLDKTNLLFVKSCILQVKFPHFCKYFSSPPGGEFLS